MVELREVRETDAQEWFRMRSILWPQYKQDHPGEIKQFFSGDSVDIINTVVLAADDSALVGFLELNIRNFAEGSRSKKLPYVEAWFVDELHRGLGYGKKLMLYAEQWALRQGFSELASDTEIENVRSISMHKHLGFQEIERIVCFLKRLE